MSRTTNVTLTLPQVDSLLDAVGFQMEEFANQADGLYRTGHQMAVLARAQDALLEARRKVCRDCR